MKDLIIKISTSDNFSNIPYVNLNAETGICEISGESYMDNIIEFFNPIFKWITDYTQDTSKLLTFKIKLKYYNTGTSRGLFAIMELLKEFEEKGGTVQINWYHNTDDIDMKEDIMDIIKELEIDVKLIPIDF